MDRVKKTSFDNSDNNSGNSDGGAYSEEEVDESEFRDDFSLSDEDEFKNDPADQSPEGFEKNEEERDRDFFGDEDYGTL